MEKHDLKSFIANIDKIISGESIIPSECDHGDEQYRELLLLAQFLSDADYTAEARARMERIWSNIHKKDELTDDDLDMVAGGVNPNAMSDKNENNGK